MEKEERNIIIVATLGMAFWWPLLRNSVVGFLLSPSRVGEALGHGGLALFLVASATMAGAMGAYLGKAGGCRGVTSRRKVYLAVLAPCVAASGCGLVLVAEPSAAGVVALAYALMLSVVYVVLPMGWTLVLLRWLARSRRRMLLVVVASYAASFLVGYLSYAPEPWSFVRPVGAPILSGAAWIFCYRTAGISGSSAGANGDFDAVPQEGMRFDGQSLYLLVLLVFLVSSVATGFINSGTASYVPSINTLVRDTLNVFAAFSIIALIAVSKSLERIKFLLVVVLIMLFFGGIFLATLFQQSWFTIGTGLMQTSKSCFSLVLFLLVMLESSGRAAPEAVRAMLLKFVLPTAASTFVSYFMVPLVADGFGVSYHDFWGVLSLLLGFSLGVFLFGLLSSMVTRYLPRTELPVKEGHRGPQSVVSAMRQAYGLTEKEAEVLELLLEGNTYKKIAALMYVSDSTVQTHAKSIYRKVDVHTKQELVDRARALRDQRGL